MDLSFLKKTEYFKCPYCLETYHKDEFEIHEVNSYIDEIRCPNPEEVGSVRSGRGPSALIAEESQLQGQTIGTRRLCGKKLPLNFFEGESKVISIAGGYNVGKTYYSYILLDILLNSRILHKYGISGSLIYNEETIKNKIDRFLISLSRGEKFTATNIQEAKDNLLIQITIKRGRSRKFVYLSLYDNPGEGFKDIGSIIANLPSVYKSDALLFLFEPKQINTLMHASVSNTIGQGDSVDNITNVLSNTIEILRHVNNKKGNTNKFQFISDKRISIPTALCISKFDEVENLFYHEIPRDNDDLELAVLNDNKIDYRLIDSISNEIKNHLFNEETGDYRLKNLIEDNLKNYRYFGVQSIRVVGKDEGETLFTSHPKGVILPILWLFRQLSLI